MRKKQYLCKRITKKKDCSFCCGGGEQSEENESVLCLKRQNPERGETLLFFECKGTAFI